ncbi:MAG: undecaprenyl-diphosphate phosphatase [Candidatus Paceibacterota bacterium]|jgi:undecaprenyl-diphosphatase
MFIEIIKAAILGVVEGATEFLPISSTGHLILVNQWISFSNGFTAMFDIVIQLGAILSVVVYFWDRLWPFGKDAATSKTIWDTWFKAVTGVVPAIILGYFLGEMAQEKLFNPWVVAIALFVGGLILIFIEKKKQDPRFDSVQKMTYQTAFCIGLFQCLSMIPGTSRSAATIIGAMLLGVSRTAAVEFSFFLAIPTMVAASGYSLLKQGLSMTSSEAAILATGFVTAFLVAWASIKFLMNYIKNRDFKLFAYYRIILGALIIAYFLFK